MPVSLHEPRCIRVGFPQAVNLNSLKLLAVQTVPMAWSVRPGGVVHAFEVLRPSYELLIANVGLAQLGNVVAHHCAVGSFGDLAHGHGATWTYFNLSQTSA